MKRFLFSALSLSLLACGPAQGKSGGACKKSSTADQLAGAVFSGDGSAFYKCDEGLICNQSKEPFVCEPILLPGAACSRDEACDSARCIDGKCLTPASLSEGKTCLDVAKQPVYEACADGLFCNPENGGKCLPKQDIDAICDPEQSRCKDELICGPDNKCAKP